MKRSNIFFFPASGRRIDRTGALLYSSPIAIGRRIRLVPPMNPLLTPLLRSFLLLLLLLSTAQMSAEKTPERKAEECFDGRCQRESLLFHRCVRTGVGGAASTLSMDRSGKVSSFLPSSFSSSLLLICFQIGAFGLNQRMNALLFARIAVESHVF